MSFRFKEGDWVQPHPHEVYVPIGAARWQVVFLETRHGERIYNIAHFDCPSDRYGYHGRVLAYHAETFEKHWELVLNGVQRMLEVL
jgi:hypothetical protein